MSEPRDRIRPPVRVFESKWWKVGSVNVGRYVNVG